MAGLPKAHVPSFWSNQSLSYVCSGACQQATCMALVLRAHPARLPWALPRLRSEMPPERWRYFVFSFSVQRPYLRRPFLPAFVCSEMPPEGRVGVSPVCVLGVNINAGQEVSLRLRTDDLRGGCAAVWEVCCRS
jgi:hypothetical protein